LDSAQIRELLGSSLTGCEISVSGEGGKFEITAIGDAFSGLNAVKRQQKIYAILNNHIASGAIHAVTMRLFTADEYTATANRR